MWRKPSPIYLYPVVLQFPSGPTLLVGTSECFSKETLRKKEIMCGIVNNRSSCSALNHLILIGKYLAPVVQRADNSLQQITRYPVDKMYWN